MLIIIFRIPGLLISKYRVLAINADTFKISIELSPILLKTVIDKVSAILLSYTF